MQLSKKTLEIAERAEQQVKARFEALDRVAQQNTRRVLESFQAQRISDGCFAGTTGYGYNDLGREKLEGCYSEIFGCESALVRVQFVNGTHAITCAILACMQSGDLLLSLTGPLYDTLRTLTGSGGALGGTFADFGMHFSAVPMKGGRPDYDAIEHALKSQAVKAAFIQRSRGYMSRDALSVGDIEALCALVKKTSPETLIIVDNCYGEFCEEREAGHCADLICGSLTKNPGGGLAPAGGYICGKAELVDRAANVMTAPGIGGECGATLGANRLLFQGLYVAPHVVSQALKTAVFAASALSILGFSVSPRFDEPRFDIIQSIDFKAPQPLLAFCRGIQRGSPVDSFASPEPWDMPGYDCPVVMAAGAFVQGSSIELSCDAPMREPYTAFMQGGITYEGGRLGVLYGVEELLGIQAV